MSRPLTVLQCESDQKMIKNERKFIPIISSKVKMRLPNLVSE